MSIKSNSSELIYLSLATLISILSIIFRVVLTPTSDVIKISSNLSKTSSSTLLFPIIAFEIFPKKVELVFFNPLLRESFFYIEKNLEKNDLLFESSSSIVLDPSTVFSSS